MIQYVIRSHSALMTTTLQSVIHSVEKSEDLGTPAHGWFAVPHGNTKSDKELVENIDSWVDIRDIVAAHVAALEKPRVGGERILAPGGKLVLLRSFRNSDFRLRFEALHLAKL